jgi:hypothetical protein
LAAPIGKCNVRDVSIARVEMFGVSFAGVALAVMALVVSDDVPARIGIAVTGALLCLPILFWSTGLRLRITKAIMVLSCLLVIPSLVVVGPVFVLPAALLSVDAVRRLEAA